MISYERQKQILEILRNKDSATIQSLCAKLYASPATVRRDLAQMERDGLIVRVRGGATLKDMNTRDTPFLLRSNINTDKKEIIASLAVKLIEDSSSVMLDSSTTTTVLARNMGGIKDLTVITNGLAAIAALNELSDARVIVTGGFVKNNSSLLGDCAVQMIQKYYADIAFFSCRGIDIAAGATDAEEESASFKRAMLSRCAKRVLLCDSTKFSSSYLCSVCHLKDIDIIITDKKPSDDFIKSFGGKVIFPKNNF